MLCPQSFCLPALPPFMQQPLTPSGIFCTNHLTCLLATHPSFSLSQGPTCLSCLLPALLSQMPSNSGRVATSHSSSPSHRKPARVHILQPAAGDGGGNVPPPKGWQDRITGSCLPSPLQLEWWQLPSKSRKQKTQEENWKQAKAGAVVLRPGVPE